MDLKHRRGRRRSVGGPKIPRKAHGKSPAVPLRRGLPAAAPPPAVPAPPAPLAAEPPAAAPALPPAAGAAAGAPMAPERPEPPLRRAAAPEFTAYGTPAPTRRGRRRLPEPVADPTLRGPRPARERLWPAALVILVVLAAAGAAAYHWRDRLLPPPPAPPPTAEASPDAVAKLGAPETDLSEIRRLLRQLDFAPGPDSEALDDATRAAISQFQQMAGLPETGQPSPELLDELRQVAKPLDAKK
jgi:hypothetical protein